MKHTLSQHKILYHAVVLECYGSPYTLGIFTNEKSAMDRLEVARKQIVCDTPEPIWMYVETVRNGTVINRRDLSFENPIAEVHAAM